MSEIYRFIAVEKANFPVALLCRILGVPRSSFYAWAEGHDAGGRVFRPTRRSRTRSRWSTLLPGAPTVFRASMPSSGGWATA
ncbi:hypothetical protein ACH4S8_44025 [Streptomyces sp. NPDC021080]|uniref:hypothetical protein n=1 Tax=Streptomyces sp. NPDC021080 TaxID=3365110 RepID=UPI003791BD2D